MVIQFSMDGLPSLQWCHNGHDGIWNHKSHDCLLNRSFRRTSKKTSKLCVTDLCKGNSPVTGELSNKLLWGEFTSDQWIPHTKGQISRKCFHLMTSSYHVYFSKFLIADEASWQDQHWLPYCFHCQTVYALQHMIVWEVSWTCIVMHHNVWWFAKSSHASTLWCQP